MVSDKLIVLSLIKGCQDLRPSGCTFTVVPTKTPVEGTRHLPGEEGQKCIRGVTRTDTGL